MMGKDFDNDDDALWFSHVRMLGQELEICVHNV